MFLGSIMASETTAARPVPSATSAATPSPCCRSAATTWPTTSRTGSASARRPDRNVLPKIFYVNWFRKDENGKFLWPGYGENSRVLEWVFNRVADKAPAVDTPIGSVPTVEAIDTDGLNVSVGDMEERALLSTRQSPRITK